MLIEVIIFRDGKPKKEFWSYSLCSNGVKVYSPQKVGRKAKFSELIKMSDRQKSNGKHKKLKRKPSDTQIRNWISENFNLFIKEDKCGI